MRPGSFSKTQNIDIKITDRLQISWLEADVVVVNVGNAHA